MGAATARHRATELAEAADDAAVTTQQAAQANAVFLADATARGDATAGHKNG